MGLCSFIVNIPWQKEGGDSICAFLAFCKNFKYVILKFQAIKLLLSKIGPL